MTPTGSQQSPETPGNVQLPGLVVPSVVPLPSGMRELADLWQSMDERGRADLLNIARGLAANAERSHMGTEQD